MYKHVNPLLVRAWKSGLHHGTFSLVFDALHLLWQDAHLYVQQRPLDLLEILVKVIRTALAVNPSDALALKFAQEYACYGGEMKAVKPLGLIDAAHSKFTNFYEW